MNNIRLEKIAPAFYIGPGGLEYFCLAEFLSGRKLPDHTLLKLVVIEDLLRALPGIRMLESLDGYEIGD
jgi:hypothetical protein